jgi:hypothetical protein
MNERMRWFAVLLASAVLLTTIPVLAMGEESSDYPMFHYDAQRTGNAEMHQNQTSELISGVLIGMEVLR